MHILENVIKKSPTFSGNAELQSETFIRLSGKNSRTSQTASIAIFISNRKTIFNNSTWFNRKTLGKCINLALQKDQRKNSFSSKLQSKELFTVIVIISTISIYTRDNAQVVTIYMHICKQVVRRLLSSRYHDVFALLVPSCCDKSGTSCYHLVTRLMTATVLLQVVPTRLIQAVSSQVATSLLSISGLLELVASLLTPSTLLQDDNNLFQTCQHASCQQAVRFLHVYPILFFL
jgi:hypothetical protein